MKFLLLEVVTATLLLEFGYCNVRSVQLLQRWLVLLVKISSLQWWILQLLSFLQLGQLFFHNRWLLSTTLSFRSLATL